MNRACLGWIYPPKRIQTAVSQFQTTTGQNIMSPQFNSAWKNHHVVPHHVVHDQHVPGHLDSLQLADRSERVSELLSSLRQKYDQV